MKTLTHRRFTLLLACTLVLLATACGDGDREEPFEPGPLGAVEVGPGEAIQIRTLLTHSVRQEIGLPLRNSAELAVSDYGPIHGRAVRLGDPVDSLCSPEGGEPAPSRSPARKTSSGSSEPPARRRP